MKNLLSIASSIIYVLIIVMATLSSCERINIYCCPIKIGI